MAGLVTTVAKLGPRPCDMHQALHVAPTGVKEAFEGIVRGPFASATTHPKS